MKKETARKKRGQTTLRENNVLVALPDTALIKLLGDRSPQKRTSAAKLLGKKQSIQAVPSLCQQLAKEKALYARIAISEALGNIGESALTELIKLLGKIGGNQHRELPTNIFRKWNYPLPRDIVARTIIKIGLPALKPLQNILKSGNETQVLEAIDAIGYISFNFKDQSSFPALVEALDKYKTHPVITWKIVRALEAFPHEESISLLQDFLLKSRVPALRWEAARSLGQIGSKECRAILKEVDQQAHPLVKKMVKLALNKIDGVVTRTRGNGDGLPLNASYYCVISA
ncbi:MAG: HEAT repeat domain-containing protein [Candidatus Saganbacteria bacterium]|nr:HEAT repeat domain-containing protein [Candidatus Saganbacteria bacterium]